MLHSYKNLFISSASLSVELEVRKVHGLAPLLPTAGHHMPGPVRSVGGCPIVTCPGAIVCFKQPSPSTPPCNYVGFNTEKQRNPKSNTNCSW
jgi:hypothetical protein